MAEIVGADDRFGANMTQVAFAHDVAEGEMIKGLLEDRGISCFLQPAGIDGPMLGVGLLPRSAQRVMVHPDRADAARRLLTEVLVEADSDGKPGETISEVTYAEETTGRKPRNYGLIDAYVRASLLSLGAMGLAFGVFLLLRGT